MRCVSTGRTGTALTHLGLSRPLVRVLWRAAAADVDVFARLYEHVRSRDDIRDRRLPGVVAGDPERDRDVVGCIAEGDGQQTVDAEQQLGAAVIECWAGSAGDDGDGGDDVL